MKGDDKRHQIRYRGIGGHESGTWKSKVLHRGRKRLNQNRAKKSRNKAKESEGTGTSSGEVEERQRRENPNSVSKFLEAEKWNSNS